MPDIYELKSLAVAVKTHITSPGALIGIEGHSTAGKTTLSTAFAAAIGGAAIATDNYIDRDSNANNYADRIQLEKLRLALTESRRSHQAVLIEGICLRDTLQRLELVPQAFIYCKRISQGGLWADDPENYLDDGSPRSDLSWVDRQSVVYHLLARPLENADLVYAWQEP